MSVRFITPPADLYAITTTAQAQAQDIARADNLRRSRGLARTRPANVGPRIAR